jgi:hypothetical protein
MDWMLAIGRRGRKERNSSRREGTTGWIGRSARENLNLGAGMTSGPAELWLVRACMDLIVPAYDW